MARDSDNRKLGYRIFLGVVVLVLGGSMLLYLVPQTPGTGEAATDTVAKVGDQSVTLGEVRQQLAQIEQRNQVPKPLESLYARLLPGSRGGVFRVDGCLYAHEISCSCSNFKI